MPQIMLDMGEPMVVNDTEVGNAAKHPNRIEDIQLVRFYLNITRNMDHPPNGSNHAPDRDVMTEDADLVGRIFQFQLREARNLRGSGHYVTADGKVSVPKSSGGTLSYGAGLYTIRQLASTWEIYKAINGLSPGLRMSQHNACGALLRTWLIQRGF